MTNPSRRFTYTLRSSVRGAAFTLTLLCALPATTVQSAQAQTFTVIHAFTGDGDGATPKAGLVMDRAGNLYGTASAGGAGYGTVFKLAHSGSSWTLSPLYAFQGGSDGQTPIGALVVGPNGSLYGTTEFGGPPHHVCSEGCGTVFNLRPSPTRQRSVFAPWVKTVIYPFSYSDGAFPLSEVIFDAAGNLYGTTFGGASSDCDGAPCSSCNYDCGVVYELTPGNGSWTQTVLFYFSDTSGSNPSAGLVLDAAGSLYGVTPYEGPYTFGSAFKLTPSASGWTETPLYFFQGSGDGGGTYGTLVRAPSGVFYGGNPGYGQYGGTVFSLTAFGQFSEAYAFPAGAGPVAGVSMDASGSLYGVTELGGAYNFGSVFKLTPSNDGWVYTSLHDFTGGTDGCSSLGKVLIDAAGNLYGTTSACGANGDGAVFEITQ